MIELSIGILILAGLLLFIGDRQTEKRVQDSYEEGFIAGMQHIIDKRYEELNEEMKKD